MSAVDIVTELRSRLEAAGYNVHLGKHIDPAQGDPLPCISIHETGDGDQTSAHLPVRVQSLGLVAEYWCESSEDPLIEALIEAGKIRAAMIHEDSVDRRDSLGGLVDKIEHKKSTTFTHSRPYATVQVAVSVQY